MVIEKGKITIGSIVNMYGQSYVQFICNFFQVNIFSISSPNCFF